MLQRKYKSLFYLSSFSFEHFLHSCPRTEPFHPQVPQNITALFHCSANERLFDAASQLFEKWWKQPGCRPPRMKNIHSWNNHRHHMPQIWRCYWCVILWRLTVFLPAACPKRIAALFFSSHGQNAVSANGPWAVERKADFSVTHLMFLSPLYGPSQNTNHILAR